MKLLLFFALLFGVRKIAVAGINNLTKLNFIYLVPAVILRFILRLTFQPRFKRTLFINQNTVINEP